MALKPESESRPQASSSTHPSSPLVKEQTTSHAMPVGVPHEFKPEELVTPPSCPPLVGGYGAETPEAKTARDARETSKQPAPDRR